MNERERIRLAIAEWKEKQLPSLKERRINMKLFTGIDHIIDIVGTRRSGKTYLMFLVAKKLFEQGFDRDSVIYINFENKALYPLNDRLLDELLNYVLEKKAEKSFLFLDEIHNISGWEGWTRTVYDDYKGKIKIVVSGSSSRIMAEEVSSLLTGRHVSLHLFPLDFRELLGFREVEVDGNLPPSRKKLAEIKALFEEYMKFGGFPEICLLEKGVRNDILRSYYDDILYKDIIRKFRVREVSIMENFARFFFSSVGAYFSFKRGKEHLESMGVNASTRTLLRYTSLLEEAFLFFFLPIFTRRVRDMLKYPRKIYCIDTGLRSAVSPFSEDSGRTMENIVFLKLKQMAFADPSLSVNYWKDRK